MPLSTQPYKGARDFYPEDKRVQKYMFATMRKVVESFGYEEYDAPILEPIELYLAKTGEEIVNEQTYVFKDRGDRQVVIRPEMTPTVSRMVAAKRQDLAYPVRWYSLPNLWRYERPQKGRLREHWQLNVDLFGIEGLDAELEIVKVADGIMQAFGAKRDMYTIKLNSRKLIDYILKDYLGLDETQALTMSKLIDRMAKMEYSQFAADVEGVFSPSQREAGKSDQLLSLLKLVDLEELPAELKTQPAVDELQKIIDNLRKSAVTNVVFDITLMRGFDYYTNVVFEVYDTHPENNRSMFGGGRYDGLVGLFGVEPVPTVGFGMGDVTLQNFLQDHGLMPELKPSTDLYLVQVGVSANQVDGVLSELREMGINVAIDLTGRKPDKQIKTAVKQGIKYALFVGPQELESEQFTLRDLVAGTEEKHSLQRTVSIIKDTRK